MDQVKSPAARVVILDDDLGHLEMLQAALASESLEIYASPNPEEAFELIRLKRPHIVLLDLFMPKHDGMEMLEKIVELDASIDVIIITGQYSSESAVQAIQKRRRRLPPGNRCQSRSFASESARWSTSCKPTNLPTSSILN